METRFSRTLFENMQADDGQVVHFGGIGFPAGGQLGQAIDDVGDGGVREGEELVGELEARLVAEAPDQGLGAVGVQQQPVALL